MKKHLKKNILTIINEQDTHIIPISKFSGERLDLGKKGDNSTVFKCGARSR